MHFYYTTNNISYVYFYKIGWSNGSDIFTGITDPNPDNDLAVMLMPNFVYDDPCSSTACEFDYMGKHQTFVVPATGYYQVEVWGASGGSSDVLCDDGERIGSYLGGYGSYSTGVVYMTENEQYYVYVGGAGEDASGWWDGLPDKGSGGSCYARRYPGAGGFNGGGSGKLPYTADNTNWSASAGGGGATHIAKVYGLLSELESSVDDVVIVAGSGGGSPGIGGPFYGPGSTSGGGFEAKTITVTRYDGDITIIRTVEGGTQTTGYAFGQGEDGRTPDAHYSGGTNGSGGGGSGFYGGHASTLQGKYTGLPGAGGSGYIGNSSLVSSSSVIKHMSCYSCTTSTDASTLTYSSTNVSATATSDYSKTGNGYAKITYLGLSI